MAHKSVVSTCSRRAGLVVVTFFSDLSNAAGAVFQNLVFCLIVSIDQQSYAGKLNSRGRDVGHYTAALYCSSIMRSGAGRD